MDYLLINMRYILSTSTPIQPIVKARVTPTYNFDTLNNYSIDNGTTSQTISLKIQDTSLMLRLASVGGQT